MVSNKKQFLCFAITFMVSASMLFSAQASAADADHGQKLFQRCAACHYADRKGNKIGPSLNHVMERQAGTEAGYRFSPAMVNAGKNGLVWNKQTLTDYLHNPQAMVRGTRMPPVRNMTEQDIDDLIAYLIKASEQ